MASMEIDQQEEATFGNHRLAVPRRFEGGVPLVDPCLVEVSQVKQHKPLLIPPFSKKLMGAGRLEDASAQLKRQAMSKRLVFWHDLYPISPELRIGSVPPTFLTNPQGPALLSMWHAPMWEAGYRHYPTSAESYFQTIGSRRLFGMRNNPLRSVIDLVIQLEDMDILLHYVFAVCLQFYLSVRNAWFQVRTDKGSVYNERNPPFLFMLMRGTDLSVRIDQDTTPLLSSHDNAEAFAHLAATESLPMFFYHVCLLIATPMADPEEDCSQILSICGSCRTSFHSLCRSFAEDKLKKNFMQSLTTMRFRDVLPVNILEAMRLDPRHATLAAVKFYPRPMACSMIRVRTNDDNLKARLPSIFCHTFFSPTDFLVFHDPPPTLDQALAPEEQATALAEAEALRSKHLRWMLRLYYPLSQANGKPKVKWQLPTTVQEKWQYDDYIVLNPVRARYSFYTSQDKDSNLYLFVPNLMLPAEMSYRVQCARVVDETDIRHMTPQAWEWCIHNGTAITTTAGLEVPSWISQQEQTMIHNITHTRTGRDHCWFLYHALWTLLRSEQDAAATVSRLWTLEDLQHSRSLYVDDLVKKAFDDGGSGTIFPPITSPGGWDRCSHYPLTMPLQEHLLTAHPQLFHYWSLLFPSAAISMAGRPWVHYWTAESLTPHTDCILKKVVSELTTKAILSELSQLKPYMLSPAHQHQMAVTLEFLRTFRVQGAAPSPVERAYEAFVKS